MLTEQTVRGPAGHTYREKVFDRQVAGGDARRGLVLCLKNFCGIKAS